VAQPVPPKPSNFPNSSEDRARDELVRGHDPTRSGKSDTNSETFLLSLEDLYRELDGALARHGGVAWRLRILGIHLVGDERWIQVSAAAGGTRHDLVLHMSQGSRGDDAIASIETWLAHPLPAIRVIHVC
jgi:hypothetical protein